MLRTSWALAGLLLLALSAPVARAADGCTVDNGSEATIACTGDVPEKAPGGDEWAAALASLQNASTVALSFDSVNFTAAAFQRALTLVVGVGEPASVGSVSVNFNGCTMLGVEVDLATAAPLAGSTQYVINLSSCSVRDSAVNATAFLAAQTNLDVSLRLLGSDVSNNTLMAAGAVAVGATGKAAITLAEGSVVSDNTAVLLGALAVGGDGELSVQLASSNVTGNSLELMGLVALGGNATLAVDGASDAGVRVEGNAAEVASLMVVQGQPLVATVMEVVTGLGFGTEGFNLSTALDRAQAQVCAGVARLNLTAAAGELPPEVVQAVAPAALKIFGLLCAGDKPAANFTLGSLSGSLTELLGSGANSSGIVAALESVVESLLGPEAEQALEGVVSGLVANGTVDPAALDSLLAALLTSPAADTAAGVISDLLGKVADWLEAPLGGGGGTGNGTGTPGGEAPAGLDLGGVISEIFNTTSSPVGQAATDALSTIEGLLAGLTNGSTSAGDVVNSIVQTLTGGEGSLLAGTDVTSFIPILQAVVSDPEARGQLPALLQAVTNGDGGIGSTNLGPILGAILGNPDASAALPSLLGLLGKLGLQLPGAAG